MILRTKTHSKHKGINILQLILIMYQTMNLLYKSHKSAKEKIQKIKMNKKFLKNLISRIYLS